jgi:glycosyltransferase involved in cell wall biosynthesis
MKKYKMSVAVPTHSMQDGKYFFKRLLDSLWNQTFQDFEIVICDNSDNDVIEEICDWYRTGIQYYRNPRKGMAQNTNEAIRFSKGEIIKILYMDDYLAHDEALEKIVKHFRGQWLVSGCTHTINGEDFFNAHIPHYCSEICTGKNTIGSPSVLTIKNDHPLFFDEEMTWVLDCDYYKRMYDIYGEPTILKDINVVMGIHEGQATNTMGDKRKLQEQEYLIKKYA